MPLRVQVPVEDHYEKLIACQAACPVHTDARGYVRAIAEGRFDDAYLIARGPNPFASICGRICGAPCETACRRGTIRFFELPCLSPSALEDILGRPTPRMTPTRS